MKPICIQLSKLNSKHIIYKQTFLTRTKTQTHNYQNKIAYIHTIWLKEIITHSK